MTIGERIKSVREKSGMSQVDFADKINVSKQTLYKYENNIITNIPSDKIERIASIGGVSPAYLMGWKDEENQEIANRFNQIRKEKNISLEYISKATNLPLSYIKKISIGAADTESEDMALIASALGVSFFYLMGWKDKETMLARRNFETAFHYDEAVKNLEALGADYTEVFNIFYSMNETGKKKALDNLRDLSKLYTQN